MALLGPWPADRRVAVAVSGGADSLCLAWLVSRWGRVTALIVDHGLRAESPKEAAETAARLARFGVASHILTLSDLHRGPALAARARTARYAALTEAAAAAGITDLLLGHHLRDQAETVLMRRLSHSHESGLAGMAPIVETPRLRLVRPLLGVPPGRLRATLQAAGVDWVEDPSNRDPAALRSRLRAQLADPHGDGPETRALAASARHFADLRASHEAATAAILAERATIWPEGYAILSPGALPVAALATLLRAIGGACYAPAEKKLLRLAADPRPAVIGGVRLLPAGRLGPGWLVVREPAAVAPPVRAWPGAAWDRRFRLADSAEVPGNAVLGGLGPDATGLRGRTHLPAAVLGVLPAIRVNAKLAVVPHIGYPDWQTCARMAVMFAPASPAAGAPFGVTISGVTVGGMPTDPTEPMFVGADREAAAG